MRRTWCYATAMLSPIPSHLLCRTPGAPPVMRYLRVRGDHPHRCVTSGEALNLVDPEVGIMADWHDFCWRTTAEPAPYAAHSGDQRHQLTSEALGEARAYDGRPSLKRVGHPAASRPGPVWCAHHDRAIVEMAWARWSCGLFSGPFPLAPSVIHDWLWTAQQLDSIRELAQAVESRIPAAGRHGWHRWWAEQLDP